MKEIFRLMQLYFYAAILLFGYTLFIYTIMQLYCYTIIYEPIPKVILCRNYKFTFMSFREIDDVLWKSIEPYLPPQKSLTGRPRADMRKLMNGILYVL